MGDKETNFTESIRRQMTNIYWRPELLKMISEEPCLTFLPPLSYKNFVPGGENIVFVTMDSLYMKG